MNRRTMIAGTISAVALGSLRPGSLFAQSTPAAPESDYPDLLIVVNDDGFDVPQPLSAGRYRVTVRNDSSQEAHTAFGRMPDGAMPARRLPGDPPSALLSVTQTSRPIGPARSRAS